VSGTLSDYREHFGVREWGHRAPLAVRLLRRVVEDDNGCWLWQGARFANTGYGAVAGRDRRQRLAHRSSYRLIVGPIPDGLQLDHLCRVRSCVNPAHLEPVTARENIRRSPIHVGAAAACPAGHEYTAENTYRVRGRRYCRECMRRRRREYRDRQRAAARAA
jgi:hypothetical protein